MSLRISLVAIVATLVARGAPAQTPERFTVPGDDVAVYNLVGQLKVEGGTGTAVVIEVTRHGADAARLKIGTGEIRGRQTLRVIYDADEITYALMERGSNTTEHVRDDGTFDDNHRGHWLSRGREVRISGSRGGLDAYADLRVVVPAGKTRGPYLSAGKGGGTHGGGNLAVNASPAGVDASPTPGPPAPDTASGDAS